MKRFSGTVGALQTFLLTQSPESQEFPLIPFTPPIVKLLYFSHVEIFVEYRMCIFTKTPLERTVGKSFDDDDTVDNN